MRLVRGSGVQAGVTAVGDALILRGAWPWREAPACAAEALAGLVGKRVFVECACRFDDVWMDGPLAHVLPDGSVASYVPSGGPAILEVPDVVAPGLKGVSWEEATRLEGAFGQRLLRCLAAEMDARLPREDLRFVVEAADLRSACLLGVVRKVRYDEVIEVAYRGEVGAAFRRFAQNAGLVKGKGTEGLRLDFGLSDGEVRLLAEALNELSDLLPESIGRTSG